MTIGPRPARWRQRAACRGLPPALFFPPPDTPAGDALDVCARCPVRADCDADATTNGEEYGIWGGRTETERAELSAPTAPVVRRQPGPAPGLSDDDLVDLIWSLDPDQPAAVQIIGRLRVSVPTAYKYLHRAERLGLIERRGRHLHPCP